MKTFLHMLIGSWLLCCAPLVAAEKPNFIIILADDLGYNDVGFNGSKDVITPNIDRIANEGTKFSNGYVSYPVCGPSRAGLLTGRYQERFGFGRNPHIDPTDNMAGLPLNEQMIPEVLKPIGYTSSIIGKWHMGAHPKFHPNKRGFDHFYGFLSGGHNYFSDELIYDSIEHGIKTYKGSKDWLAWYQTRLLENNTRVDIDEYLTDELSSAAVSFIERKKDQPFFLYLAYNAPHGPLQASQQYLDRNMHIKDSKRRTYAAMITAVDDGVGRVLAKLTQLGIDDNTLIFFLSDNGGPEKHNASDNGLLRGGKGDYFEGGIHVPFAVRWPKKIPAGFEYSKPVSSLDILATFAGISQAPIAKKRPLDGVNLMPYITGKNQGSPHEVLFWRNFDRGILATRQGNSKAIYSLKQGNHLFNLDKDLSETNNLIKSSPERFEQHKRAMTLWKNELIDPIFTGLLQAKKSKKKAD